MNIFGALGCLGTRSGQVLVMGLRVNRTVDDLEDAASDLGARAGMATVVGMTVMIVMDSRLNHNRRMVAVGLDHDRRMVAMRLDHDRRMIAVARSVAVVTMIAVIAMVSRTATDGDAEA